jgi:flagellar protein FliL
MADDKDAEQEKDEAKKGADAKGGAKDDDGPSEGGETPKGRFGFLKNLLSRKMLMFVVAPVVLVLLLGVGAYMFLFSGGDEAAMAEGEHGEAGAHGEAGGEGGAHGVADARPVFFDVPDILVNVSAGGDKPAFLKLSVSLELEGGGDEHATETVEQVMPRVVDQLQTYLRELRVEDLTGSASVFRLKEELLRRVNLAVEPIKVKDVLFREMIIQ